MLKSIFLCVIIISIIHLYRKYRPSLDITRKGDILFWYSDENGSRTYKNLTK